VQTAGDDERARALKSTFGQVRREGSPQQGSLLLVDARIAAETELAEVRVLGHIGMVMALAVSRASTTGHRKNTRTRALILVNTLEEVPTCLLYGREGWVRHVRGHVGGSGSGSESCSSERGRGSRQ